LLKQGYVDLKLKSLLQNFNGRHQEMINRYEMFISQTETDSFPLTFICFALLPAIRSPDLLLITRGVFYKNQKMATLHEGLGPPSIFGDVRAPQLFNFL
jgi:hypothetical protein